MRTMHPHHKFAASERPPNRPVHKPGGYRLTRCMAIISALTSPETSPTAAPHHEIKGRISAEVITYRYGSLHCVAPFGP